MFEHMLIKSTEVFTPHPEEGHHHHHHHHHHHPCCTALTEDVSPGKFDVLHCDDDDDDDKYRSDGQKSKAFPGPLMSAKMQKDKLMSFIQGKCQTCLLHVDEPEQAYFFWLIVERFCNQNGRVTMAEIAVTLFRGYMCLRRKLGHVKKQENWCLPLAELLCSTAPADEHREAIIEMGNNFASRGWTYAAHICYVVTQMELGSRPGFHLIGCDSLPDSTSDMREAWQRTEVYEYMLSLTSGFGQPDFQVFKYLYTCELSMAGPLPHVLDYCESIATMVFTFHHCFEAVFMERVITLCEILLQQEQEKPEWLLKLNQLHKEKAADARLFAESNQSSSPSPKTQDTKQDIMSHYRVGRLLGRGGFGSVYGGTRKADGKQVAIKCVTKKTKFITIPGETHSLPLEVALMKMVSKPLRCENVVELLEWFEMPTFFALVLERPVPCMDLRQYYQLQRRRLPEAVTRRVMQQLVRAAQHCCDRGVFHRDIKPENVLINMATLEVKLIDFGCGDLMKDDPYTRFAGTPVFWPPEWVLDNKYFAIPATVWSLGVVLFELVSGDLPFQNDEEIVDSYVPFVRSLSKDCYNLLMWCLDLVPEDRPTFDEILSQSWLKEELKDTVRVREFITLS